jgi:hypothetical protein
MLETTHVYKCSFLEEYFLLISLCRKKEKAGRPHEISTHFKTKVTSSK